MIPTGRWSDPNSPPASRVKPFGIPIGCAVAELGVFRKNNKIF